MKLSTALVMLLSLNLGAQSINKLKKKSITYLDHRAPELFAWSDSLWRYSEPSFKEFKSVELIKGVLRSEGFEIEDDLSGFPTMFMGSYGTEGPVIGILGESDADHPLVNKKVPFDLPNSDFGHGAGHNLLGIGSLGGVLAVKELIANGQLKGTIRYIGSTAEGGYGGRVFLVRDGYFDDLDLAIFWHPSPVTTARLSKWDAIIDVKIELSADKESETIGLINRFLNSLDSIKEEDLLIRPKIKTGEFDLAISNVTADLLLRIEHPEQQKAESVLAEIQQLLATDTSAVTSNLQVFRSVHDFIPSLSGNVIADQNIDLLGPREVTQRGVSFGSSIFFHAGKTKKSFLLEKIPMSTSAYQNTFYGYGSDIGDVSWKVPEISFVVSCLPRGLSMSNWEGAVFHNSEYSKGGMLYASKVIALSVIDYLKDPELRERIKEEHQSRIKHMDYHPLIPKENPDPETNSKRSIY